MTGQTALDALLRTATKLWPAPARVRLEGAEPMADQPANPDQPAGPDQPGHPDYSDEPDRLEQSDRTDAADLVVAEFVLVPSASRPRLVLPLHAPRAASRILRRYSHDLGRRARAGRAVTARIAGLPGVMTAVGATRSPRLTVTTPPEAPTIQTHLADILGVDSGQLVLGLGVGTARANRKPILAVCTRDGHPLAYVKVGDSDVAAELVRGEAEALRLFHSTTPDPGLEVPHVLHAGRWRDLELLVLSPLRTTARRWRDGDAVPGQAMRAVAEQLGTTTVPLTHTSCWTQLRRSPGLVLDPEQAELLRRSIDTVERKYGERVVTAGCWHGDWTPWNMAWRGDRVQLWDFERFAPDVPVGLDYVHYIIQTELRRGSAPGAARLLERGLATNQVALAGNDIAVVEATYLLELARRYVLAAQSDQGGPLRARTRWLLGLIGQRWS